MELVLPGLRDSGGPWSFPTPPTLRLQRDDQISSMGHDPRGSTQFGPNVHKTSKTSDNEKTANNLKQIQIE